MWYEPQPTVSALNVSNMHNILVGLWAAALSILYRVLWDLSCDLYIERGNQFTVLTERFLLLEPNKIAR